MTQPPLFGDSVKEAIAGEMCVVRRVGAYIDVVDGRLAQAKVWIKNGDAHSSLDQSVPAHAHERLL